MREGTQDAETVSVEALAARVAELEQRVRRGRRVTSLLAGVVVVAFLLGAAADPVRDHLRVRSLEVVDDAGVAVVRLTAGPDGGKVWVSTAAGRAHASLDVVNSDGPAGRLELTRGDGSVRVRAIAAEDRGVSVDVGDETVARLAPGKTGGRLDILNREGQAVVNATVEQDGAGMVTTVNRAGTKNTLRPPPTGF